MTPSQVQQKWLRKWTRSLIVLLIASVAVRASTSSAQSVTRAEAVKIAESFIEYCWYASTRNMKHGKDKAGVEVHTPDRASGYGYPDDECWFPGNENAGVAYKWGGNDSPRSFGAGVEAGKAAGDVYSGEKRKGGGKAVSNEAVGIDCSGFICHCWKLTTRHSTESLPSICEKLSTPADLKAGDIMNISGAHVRLFVKWLNAEKTRALFYEASPFSKTVASERDINEMTTAGFKPYRYRRIRD